MSQPLPNIALIERIIAKIERQPDCWNQLYWQSNTPEGVVTHCFGGWALALKGWQFDDCGDVIGTTMNNWDTAQVLLGLTPDEAVNLFGPVTDWPILLFLIQGVRNRYADMTGIENEPMPEIDAIFDELTLELYGMTVAELMNP